MDIPISFKISIPEDKIKELKDKLALTGFPDELDGAGWDLGVPLADIKRLVTIWKQWDWRQAEKELNEHPHFVTDIVVEGFGALNIHFVHQQSEVAGAIPLLFVHGCKLVKCLRFIFGLGPLLCNCPVMLRYNQSSSSCESKFPIHRMLLISHRARLLL